MDHESIEGIAGFRDWIVPSRRVIGGAIDVGPIVDRIRSFGRAIIPGKDSRGVVIGVGPLQCAFDRNLDEAEARRVREVLTEIVRRATHHVVHIEFGAKLDDIAGADLERLRVAIGEYRFNRLSPSNTSFDVDFVGDRIAAEQKITELEASGTEATLQVTMAPELEWDLERWQRSWLVKAGRIEELMRPGALSSAGFLGRNEQLAGVLAKDAATLRRLGITTAMLAERLTALLDPAMGRIGRDGAPPVTVEHFEIQIQQWRGFQECPWGCPDDPQWSSFDFTILNTRTREKLDGPGLIVHLILNHSFFEGVKTQYRVDPESLARVLELLP